MSLKVDSAFPDRGYIQLEVSYDNITVSSSIPALHMISSLRC
jgi:hypothetical protein